MSTCMISYTNREKRRGGLLPVTAERPGVVIASIEITLFSLIQHNSEKVLLEEFRGCLHRICVTRLTCLHHKNHSVAQVRKQAGVMDCQCWWRVQNDPFKGRG